MPKFEILEVPMIRKYSQTMRMAMRAQTNGGILYLLPNIFVRLVSDPAAIPLVRFINKRR